MITIDQHIPPPDKTSGRAKYPWRELQPGQSFLVSCTTAADRKRVRSLAYMTAARLGIELVTRVEPDGVRVWRTV